MQTTSKVEYVSKNTLTKKMPSSGISVGSDPEVLLFDPVSRKHISAIGLIGGTKEMPRLVSKGCVQEDNVMAEFNCHVAYSEDEFVSNIQGVLSDLKAIVPGLEFSRQCAAEYDDTELTHPQAMEAGCEPDFDAWKIKMNPRPKVAMGNLRCAGGHVHVGYDFKTGTKNTREQEFNRVYFTRALDVTLGVPSILMDPDTKRKQLYGKAGAHRPKPFGVEYRTLSNFWIWDDSTIRWAFRGAERANQIWKERQTEINKWGPKIVKCINAGDKELAQTICNHFGSEVL